MSVGWLRACALVMLGLFSVTALAKDKTAIVIGGGLSGLTAAYELQNKGWQVTLLEAKPSMGGRSGMATSEWIGNDKTQPVLNKYVSTFKLGTTPAPEFVRTPGYLIDGEYFSAADLATKQPATADALKRYQKTLDDLARSIDDPQNPAATSTLHALDQITVSSWLDKQNLPATARQLINQDIRTHYDEPSRLSLLYFAQQNRVYRGVSDRDLRASRLVGGSQVLAQAFVKQIKTIKTNSPVSAINQDKDGVTVKVGSVGYQADYVVLAVPLRALNKIALTPALDAQHHGRDQGHQLRLARPDHAEVQDAGVGKQGADVRRDLQQHWSGHVVDRACAEGRRQRGDQPVRRQCPRDAGVRRQTDGRSGADPSARVLSTGPWLVHRL
jgi:monoamine oxidase